MSDKITISEEAAFDFIVKVAPKGHLRNSDTLYVWQLARLISHMSKNEITPEDRKFLFEMLGKLSLTPPIGQS